MNSPWHELEEGEQPPAALLPDDTSLACPCEHTAGSERTDQWSTWGHHGLVAPSPGKPHGEVRQSGAALAGQVPVMGPGTT